MHDIIDEYKNLAKFISDKQKSDLPFESQEFLEYKKYLNCFEGLLSYYYSEEVAAKTIETVKTDFDLDKCCSGWAVIGNSYDDETFALLDLIERSTGFRPKHLHSHGSIRAFILHSNLNPNEPLAFQNGVLIGTKADVIKKLNIRVSSQDYHSSGLHLKF